MTARQVLSLTLFRDTLKTPTPWRITYNGIQIILTEDQYQELLGKLPEFWNTDDDQLILFRFFDDETYFCERFKKIYNYYTKSWEEKPYTFDAADSESVKNLFSIVISFYQEIRLSQLQDVTAELEKGISDISVVKIFILNTRATLLEQTDFLFTTDYPLEEAERQEWANYRQELRDITSQDAWIDNDYANIKMPVSPNVKVQTRSILNALSTQGVASFETLAESTETSPAEEVEDFITNIARYHIKQQIITGIARIGLPLADISLGTKYGTASMGVQRLPDFLEGLEQMKQKIDTQLQSIGSNLTFDIILEKYAMEASQNQDPIIDDEIEDIIQDLRRTQEDS